MKWVIVLSKKKKHSQFLSERLLFFCIKLWNELCNPRKKSIFTAHKHSLGQSNALPPVCYSVHRRYVFIQADNWGSALPPPSKVEAPPSIFQEEYLSKSTPSSPLGRHPPDGRDSCSFICSFSKITWLLKWVVFHDDILWTN